MATQHPDGSVAGLCSAAATCFALCSAFLALWGFQGTGAWHPIDFATLGTLALGSLALAVTPFVTRPRSNVISLGRAYFLAGVVLAWLAICLAAISSLIV